MDATELDAALARNDRRRGRAVLVGILALLIAGVCYLTLARWTAHREAMAAAAVDQARFAADFARLNASDREAAESVWKQVKAERASMRADEIDQIETVLPTMRETLDRARAVSMDVDTIADIRKNVDRLEKRLATLRASAE